MSSASAEQLSLLAQHLSGTRISVAESDRLAVSADLWPRQLLRLHSGESPILPAAVIWPANTSDLCATVRWAGDHGIALIPYGAGSSVVGGAAAEREDVVVVDLKRMDRVLDIDGEARLATAQAGIFGELFERQLNRRGFSQGHFPSSIYCSTLGGWIAARSAGQMSSRYGKIEDQVLGGTVVSGSGRVIRLPVAPAPGREWGTLIGGEGTLGIWTDATVRIHPLPEARAWRGLDFGSLEQALACAQRWMFAGLRPSVVRIYDPLDTLLHRTTHGARVPRDRGPNWLAWLGASLPKLTAGLGRLFGRTCRCVIGFEGDRAVVADEMFRALAIAGTHGAQDRGEGPGQAWYDARYAVSYRQSNAFRAGVAVDTMEVACSWDRVLPVYQAVRAAVLGVGVQVMAHFSHLYLEGCSIYFTYAFPVTAGVSGYDRLWEAALGAAVDAGANVSHHHGTGRLKRAALRDSLGGGTTVIARMREHFDPAGVLNPGVLSAAPVAAGASRRLVRRRADIASPRGGMVTAAPEDILGHLEARLNGDGMTLGEVSEHLGAWTVGEAARRGWLWRVSPQLLSTESLLLGVDGFVGRHAHAAIPGPRAAMGPDLLAALLEARPERLWLRCHPRAGSRRWFDANPIAAFATARRIRQHPVFAGVDVEVRIDEDGQALVGVTLPADAEHHAALLALLAGLSPHEGAPRPCPPLAAGMLISGPWRQVTALIGDPALAGRAVCFPWADPVGATGWLVAEASREVERAVAQRGLDRRPTTTAASERPSRGPPQVLVRSVAQSDSTQTLRLAVDGAALDNCTWCPKLCRFSCPVAVADGSETLTPRQLMLTAALERRGHRGLTTDVAERLYSCVDCGGCRTYCDHDNDVAGVLRRAREELAAQGGQPAAVRSYLDHLAATGLPPDRPAGDHPARALVNAGNASGAGTVLLLGCQGTATDPGPARAALRLTEQIYGAVRVLEPGCCGSPLWRWGDRERFAEHAREFARRFAGARRVVTDDPTCAWTLRQGYSEVGVHVPEVVTTSSMIASVEGDLANLTLPETPWTLHEACAARRHLGETSLSARFAAASTAFCPGSVLEGTGGCCGGMMIESFDGDLAARVGSAAAQDVLGGGAERMLTMSPTCRRRMRRVGAPVEDALSVWLGEDDPGE